MLFERTLRNFKNIYFEEHLQAAASERKAMIFYYWEFEVLLRIEMQWKPNL